MQAVCSIDWAAVYPSAPIFVDTSRRPSTVTTSEPNNQPFVFVRAIPRGTEGDLAPSIGFNPRSSRTLSPTARTALVRDLRTCAELQPRGSQTGVQLRRTARDLARQ